MGNIKCLDIQVIIKNYASVIGIEATLRNNLSRNQTGSLASNRRRLQACVHLVRASSNKLQAASNKLQAPSFSNNKPQASSPKHKGSSFKPQASSALIPDPGKSFTDL